MLMLYHRIEADREHEAMLEGEGRGLGCMGKWKDKENWYGGCIQQRASVIVDNTSPHGFRIILQRPETHGSSRMILRFMGSRRFLQVSTKALDTASGPGVRVDREALKKFLCKRHILLGRTFVFLYNKEGSIFLYETDEDYEREPSISQGDGKRLSLDALLQWYMPPSHNGRQVDIPFYQLCLSTNSVF
jgi:RNA-dependent RNA polymerase